MSAGSKVAGLAEPNAITGSERGAHEKGWHDHDAAHRPEEEDFLDVGHRALAALHQPQRRRRRADGDLQRSRRQPRRAGAPPSESLAARGTDGWRFGWQPTGKTALHFAAEQDARGPGEGNTVKIIQLLLDVRPHFRRPSFPAHTLRLSERAGAGGQAGSTVDARDNQGNTPLQLTHNVGVAKALLRAGADTACVNHVRMQTPRTISRVVPPYPAGCGLVRPGRGDGAGETKATRRQ